jgi:hypothetical protein
MNFWEGVHPLGADDHIDGRRAMAHLVKAQGAQSHGVSDALLERTEREWRPTKDDLIAPAAFGSETPIG